MTIKVSELFHENLCFESLRNMYVAFVKITRDFQKPNLIDL